MIERPAQGRALFHPARLRTAHSYCGALFAPALLFFAVSGLWQVFDLHKPQPGRGFEPPQALRSLSALHKDQTLATPARPARKGPSPGPKRPAPPAMGLGQALLKAYAAATSAVLALVTCLGLYMAQRSPRDRMWIAGLFALGLAAPMALLFIR
ncbi:MAG TPA: hypothetical protein VNW53_00845 [Phenylobacterium sp.]|uniref:hypothetical protein n=1 Tax=Phenylobacterium sp. TaxID=1871053 RepID=UPI002B828B8E|nr:hypothetical protein [Phenylobacterium sp.]HXA37521.1 hypothetical protein [Phenylobacterium sp.]